MGRARIAVGLDESEAARRALACAVREAAQWEGTVLVVTAWRPGTSEPEGLRAARRQISRMQRERIEEALRGVPVPVPVARQIIIADPVTALCHVATTADMVVIGGDESPGVRTHAMAAAVTERLAHRLSGTTATIRVIDGAEQTCTEALPAAA